MPLPTWHVFSLSALALLIVPLSVMGLRARAGRTVSPAVDPGGQPPPPASRSPAPFLPAFAAAYGLFMWIQPQGFLARDALGLGAATVVVFATGVGVASLYMAIFPPARDFARALFAVIASTDLLALLILWGGVRTGLIHQPAFKPAFYAAIVAVALVGTLVGGSPRPRRR